MSNELYYSCGTRIGIEIGLTMEDARSVSHAGPCDDDVKALAKFPYVAEQLAKIYPEDLRSELGEYGAWNDEELANHDENLLRWLWLSGCQIREENE